jgi:hypothetical protein
MQQSLASHGFSICGFKHLRFSFNIEIFQLLYLVLCVRGYFAVPRKKKTTIYILWEHSYNGVHCESQSFHIALWCMFLLPVFEVLFPRKWNGRDVNLTTPLHVVPGSRKVQLCCQSRCCFMSRCFMNYAHGSSSSSSSSSSIPVVPTQIIEYLWNALYYFILLI